MLTIENCYALVNCSTFLLITIVVALCTKIYVLRLIIPHARGMRVHGMLKPWILLLGVVLGSMVGDIAWVVKLVRILFVPSLTYSWLIVVVRVSWGCLIIQYQSLAFFIESLTEKNYHLNFLRKILFGISLMSSCYFFFIALCDGNLTDIHERSRALTLPITEAPLEVCMLRYTIFYLLSLITLPSLFVSLYNMSRASLPKLLKKQIKIFMVWFMIPYLIIEFLIAFYHFFPLMHAHAYAIVGVSTILLSYAVYYCICRVIRLRFLNITSSVHSAKSSNFTNGFKKVLEQLSHATTEREIEGVVQLFFKESFGVGLQRSCLYIRSLDAGINRVHPVAEQDPREIHLENFITVHGMATPVGTFMGMVKVVIRDEVEFNNFYQEDVVNNSIIAMLDAINADIFLPIYRQQTMIACIIAERYCRPEEIFDDAERDYMVVFASYLSNIIDLLQNRNLELFVQQEKELREELYHKQQEISKYHECMQAFIRNTHHKSIGVLFYKNGRFMFGNQTAKEMVDINPNIHDGHPLTKALKGVATHVANYQSPYLTFSHTASGNKMVISGMANPEHNNVIIMLYYPEISDIIGRKISLLKDPSAWDYLLYLEATHSGKMINQLMPGSGPILLNFKIEVIKAALSKKALVLNMSEGDLLSMVETLHQIRSREQLHTLKVLSSSNSVDIATKIFGINPILGARTSYVRPLLEKLSTGTLYIQNIHVLSLEVQDYLAEFIKYGFYRIFRSNQKMSSSDVHIMCSTDQDLALLVQEGRFSTALFNELKTTTLAMPSCATLPDSELMSIIEGFTQQILQDHTFKTILELTDREKEALLRNRPVSLQALKVKIKQLLNQKSKKVPTIREVSHESSSAELTYASQLGKYALKDPVVMATLWSKFKDHTQIATFLGVHRSAVHRRCKEYKLR
jgi:hypothetical protein